MLYSLSEWLQGMDVPGSRLMGYLTVRSGLAFVLSMLIAIFIGRRIIDRLQFMQIGEVVRDLGLEDQEKKAKTPTMGGIIIIIAIVAPCLLVANLSNVYMLLLLLATIWLGGIGFIDDYLKYKYKNKDGLKGKYKIIGQVGIALVVAATVYFNPGMGVVKNQEVIDQETNTTIVEYHEEEVAHTPETTLPFVKNHNFNYAWLTGWMGKYAVAGGWVVFFLVVVFMVTATSNGCNLTDGIDGLATGCSAIAGVALLIMAYLGSNIIYSAYLNIMYIPGSQEMVVYMAAFVGALVGFLWYNAKPAQVFMGDTGSLMLGGILAICAILTRKELLLPIICAIFYVEDLSVMLQVAYFKRTGGKRIFKMTPLHHHYQKPGNAGFQALIQKPLQPIPESRLTVRFWIIGIILAVAAFVTLKIR